MERLLIMIGLVGVLLGAHSCSNDFDLIDNWKDIPVVYGLISSKDTASYIRLEKAFLDPNTNALDIAQIADSLYYDDAVVTLVRKSNGQEYNLIRVNGNDEGYQRDPGDFADAPNYLYKLKLDDIDSLYAGERYQLIINRGDDLDLVTGETTMVSDLKITEPDMGQSILWNYDSDLDFRWTFNRDDAIFFNVVLDIHYSEGSGPDKVDKVIEWKVGSNITNDDNRINLEQEISAEAFFITVAGNIDGSNNVVRNFKFLEFNVVAGGQEIFDYIAVNQVNLGITGSQLLPNFTNMSEGYGIFSSVNSVSQVNFLDLESLDSLRSGFHTKHLNFQ